MPRTFSISALALAAVAAASPAVAAAPAPATPTATSAQTSIALKPAPLAALVKAVDIPYQRFTLPNGLRVLVHTDRKAPVVALSVWYGVGSKHEPKGKTGFAHLFEHLMFNGSEHSPGDFFQPLQEIGATDVNGTTWFDRTNYFETVPTGALDLALMLESDRMGYLLGAITKEKLDNQRAVVQNEKRQGDNQPFGMVEYEEFENLYPSGHPYHHSTIGSMADLDSASLDDVKGWFRDHYAPNNAILVLAGDIDLTTARDKVAHWFGPIPSGPAVVPVAAPVPTLPATKAKTIKDRVATTRIYRMWAIPGLDSTDNLPMALSGLVLGGLASSRLDDALVRKQQVAVAVSATADIFAQGGQFIVSADVKPGQDAAVVAKALDAVIAEYRAKGPSSDELTRAATVYAGGEIRGLESVGGMNGKAPTLAEGLLYSNDPAHYRTALQRASMLTPAQVRAVTAKWLTRPAFALTVEPGTRTDGGEGRGSFMTGGPDGSVSQPAFWRDPELAGTDGPAAKAFDNPDRTKLPAVGTLASLTFPTIEHATLSNGIKVYLARRPAVPVVSVRVAFDAGYGADPKDARGTQSLLLRLMNEGTRTLDSSALAKARERLGAEIHGAANTDTTWFQLEALAPNLPSSLGLLAEYVRHPALAPAELERVRAQQLATISAELNEPRAIAQRVLLPVLFGPAHPYAAAASGTGDPAVVKQLSAATLAAFHRRWFRPDTTSVFVVGDTTLPALTRLLETSFGDWSAPDELAPAKDFSAPVPAQTARIILVDRPASPQSMIYAGEVLDAKGTDDLLALKSANDVLGGNFLSRMNTNLRETKGWSYGVASGVTDPIERATFRMMAPVQADRTGDSIVELRKDLNAFLGPKGVTPEELQWTTNGSARELPGSFETNASVLEAVMKIARYKRPDNFYETLAARYRSMTTVQLDTAARTAIAPDKMVFVVVGDAAKVRPQLDALGMPVEVATLKAD